MFFTHLIKVNGVCAYFLLVIGFSHHECVGDPCGIGDFCNKIYLFYYNQVVPLGLLLFLVDVVKL